VHQQDDKADPALELRRTELALEDGQSEEQTDRRALYQLAYAMLPPIIQQRLQFVRWLVESGRLEP
jgi:hypothetical protein